MATERLSMRKTRQIRRLKWVLVRSHRELERACGVGLGTVSETVSRGKLAGLDWSAVEKLTDDELEKRLYQVHFLGGNHGQNQGRQGCARIFGIL